MEKLNVSSLSPEEVGRRMMAGPVDGCKVACSSVGTGYGYNAVALDA